MVPTAPAELLGDANVDAVYGPALDGVPTTPAPTSVALLLATAHERIHGSPAAAHLGDGIVHVVGPDDSGPTDDRWVPTDESDLAVLAGAHSPVVLAGPGVVTQRAVAGLHALAVGANLGVLNTWGAKGVFDWRSRHHWATVGLQELDFALGGLAGADVIVTTGLVDAEAPPHLWTQYGRPVPVPPLALGPLAERWSRPRSELEYPRLRTELGAVTQAGWAAATTPIQPSLATRDYADAYGGRGVVAADPGTAGYWVARTFTTTEPGMVHVPARADLRGFAPAGALVSRLRNPNRPALAVVDGPVSDAAEAVVETADRLGAPIAVEVWDPDGEALDPDAHRARLARLARLGPGERSTVVTLATDSRQLDRMIDVAGPIVAWSERSAVP